MRLNKFLAAAGVTSRRKADQLILSGRVFVNGKANITLGFEINPDSDLVSIDGKKITLAPKFIYYALYKPKGFISTAFDEHGRKTILDLVPKEPRVFPVGRLDANSEGLIILTNDGQLAQQLTHPRFEHEKEYEVTVKAQKLGAESVSNIKKSFLNGLNIDGKTMKADQFLPLETSRFPLFTFRLTLHTGYYRQIRRMCSKLGLEVLELVRIRIGKLTLQSLCLKAGQYKVISRSEMV